MFINLNNIVDVKSKKFFIEKIDLFNKTIKLFSEKNNSTLKSLTQEVEMPVSFFIDPAIIHDKSVKDLKEITLSYTMYTTTKTSER